MSESLIIRDDRALAIQFTEHALKLREQALDRAGLIGRVSNVEEREAAVGAQKALRAILNDVEKARKTAKEPVLEFGRTIDAAVKAWRIECEAEEMRVAKLVGDYEQAELARQRAAEAARLLEIQKIELAKQHELARIAADEMEKHRAIDKAEADAKREASKLTADAAAEVQREIDRQRDLATAQTLQRMESVQERFNAESAALPVVQQTRAKDQIVREDWDITVTDIWLLARAHPSCVKIEPRLSAIKDLLSVGVKVAGVQAHKKVTSTVRATRPQTLEIT